MKLTAFFCRCILTISLAATLPLTAFSSEAFADAAADDDAKKKARELANSGFEQFEAGEFDKAIALFKQADATFHAPTILLLLARAHEKKEDFVSARAVYRKIADEQLAADAPKEFVEAQKTAKDAADSLDGKIAFVKIVLKGATKQTVQISIDGVEVPGARLSEAIPANPGTRKIAATIGGDDGGRTVFQTVTLKEGTTKQIQLVFRPGGVVTAGELPPQGGGCASCEIGSLNSRGDAGQALFGVALAISAAALRRQRSCQRRR